MSRLRFYAALSLEISFRSSARRRGLRELKNCLINSSFRVTVNDLINQEENFSKKVHARGCKHFMLQKLSVVLLYMPSAASSTCSCAGYQLPAKLLRQKFQPTTLRVSTVTPYHKLFISSLTRLDIKFQATLNSARETNRLPSMARIAMTKPTG